MTDEPTGFSPDVLEGGQPPEPKQEPPKYVTEDRFAEFEDKLMRTVQSLTDKQESRIKKELASRLDEVKANIAEARAAGYNVPPEIEREMTAEAYRDVLTKVNQNKAAQPPASRPQPRPEDVEKVDIGIAKLVAKYGFKLNADDKEVSLLDSVTLDPDVYLASFEKAMQAKAASLGRSLPPEPLGGSPAARVAAPGGMPTGGIEALNAELERLQSVTHPTQAQIARRKELTAEMLKHLPKQ